MSDGSQTEVSTESSVEQTPLGSKQFAGTIESKDPLAQPTVPAPEGVPEKFWDPIEGKLRSDDLIKSYQALEAKLGQPKDEAEEASEEPEETSAETTEAEEEATEETEETSEEPVKVDFQEAMKAAQETYATTGELPEDQRKPFIDLGFTNQQIDFYLSGVKATEAALETAAHKAAGGSEAYAAAVAWAAAGGLTEKQILAFNAQTGDVETIGPAVTGLMASFKAANPGEGQLTNINGAVNHGEVYSSMEEFQQDLAAADRIRDNVARKKAVAKLARSRAAGTIKHSNRRQPFGG